MTTWKTEPVLKAPLPRMQAFAYIAFLDFTRPLVQVFCITWRDSLFPFCPSYQLVCPSPGSSYEYLHGNTAVISNINSRAQPVAELKNMQGFTRTQKPVFIDQVHDSHLPTPFRKRKGHNGFKAVTQHKGLLAKRHWLNKFYQDLEKRVWYGYDSIWKLWKGY